MSNRVIVTGAAGFIGRWSVQPLLSRGFEVHAIVSPARRAAGGISSQLSSAIVHEVDLLDATSTERVIDSVRPTHLLHFAWVATPGVYWSSRENFQWVEASLRLVRLFGQAGGQRAVVAGTCAEYDWRNASVCDEDSTPLISRGQADATPYAICKSALREMLASFCASSGIGMAWGRIFYLYGPGEHPERLVASVIGNLLRGQPTRCTHGRQVRSFLHVADVGQAFAALLDSKVDATVNVGSEEPVAIADVILEIARQLDGVELLHFGSRPTDPREPERLLPNTSRLRQLVGWKPRIVLREGIEDAINWWRAQLDVHA